MANGRGDTLARLHLGAPQEIAVDVDGDLLARHASKYTSIDAVSRSAGYGMCQRVVGSAKSLAASSGPQVPAS